MSHCWLLRGGKCSKRIAGKHPLSSASSSLKAPHSVHGSFIERSDTFRRGKTTSPIPSTAAASSKSGLFLRCYNTFWNIEQDWFFKIVTFKQLSPLLNIAGQRWWNMLIKCWIICWAWYIINNIIIIPRACLSWNSCSNSIWGINLCKENSENNNLGKGSLVLLLTVSDLERE